VGPNVVTVVNPEEIVAPVESVPAGSPIIRPFWVTWKSVLFKLSTEGVEMLPLVSSIVSTDIRLEAVMAVPSAKRRGPNSKAAVPSVVSRVVRMAEPSILEADAVVVAF
jgi:hypothetical protein